MIKEQEEVFKRVLGTKFAQAVLGKVTVELEESQQYPIVSLTVYNAITNTTFSYRSHTAYFDYFVCMHTLEQVCKDILKQYRKYVYALFYKRPSKDANTVVIE